MAPRSKAVSVPNAPIRATNVDMQALLGPPPLLDGEDAEAFGALHAQLSTAVAPSDVIEHMWVRDVVDLLWETLRLRRLKTQLVQASAHQGLDKILEPRVEWITRKRLVEGWATRDPQSMRDVRAVLKKAGLEESAIHAQTVEVKLETIEKIDRLIAVSEARRNAALREIDRRRDTLAQRLRQATQTIEDAEYSEIGSQRGAAE